MNVLALDLSTSGTGWAHTNGGSGVQSFKPRRGDSPGMRWLEFRAWLCRLLDSAPTDLIAYEQAHHRGGAATHVAHSLISCVETIAAERSIEVTNRHTASIKSHALQGAKAPKGKTKLKMMQAAENRWPHVDFLTDDQSDAVWLLDLVLMELGLPRL